VTNVKEKKNLKEAGIIWQMDDFISYKPSQTLNLQFLHLDLEFSSTQGKSFLRYIQIWRHQI